MAAALRRANALLAAQIQAQNADFVRKQYLHSTIKPLGMKMVDSSAKSLEFIIRLRRWKLTMPDHPDNMLMEQLRAKKMSDSMMRGFDRHIATLNDVYPGTFASFIDYIFKKYAPPLSIEFMEAKIKELRIRKGENPIDVYEAYLDGIAIYEECRVLINARMPANDRIPAFSIHAKFVHLRKIFIDNNNIAACKNEHLINKRMRQIFTRAHPNNYATITHVLDDGLKEKIKPICDAANKDLNYITYKSESKIHLFNGNGRKGKGNDAIGDTEFKGNKCTPYDGYVC